MGQRLAHTCEFATERLDVGDWHRLVTTHEFDLVTAVQQLLTPATTNDLPEQWQGSFGAARASAWIVERDQESPTLIAFDRTSRRVVGLLILFESDAQPIDLRIGYIIAEDSWGHGFATELVQGLVAWTESIPETPTLTAGVAKSNSASQQVLEKADFAMVNDDGKELLFQHQPSYLHQYQSPRK